MDDVQLAELKRQRSFLLAAGDVKALKKLDAEIVRLQVGGDDEDGPVETAVDHAAMSRRHP
jgi:hypothetical protein